MLVRFLFIVILVFVLWKIYDSIYDKEGFEIPNYKSYHEYENPEIIVTANGKEYERLKQKFDKLTLEGKGSISEILDKARETINANTLTIKRLQKEVEKTNKYSK